MEMLVLILGSPLALIAAAMAFLITYEEYGKHHLEKQEVLAHSLEVGGVTLLFFLGLTFLLGLTLPTIVGLRW